MTFHCLTIQYPSTPRRSLVLLMLLYQQMQWPFPNIMSTINSFMAFLLTKLMPMDFLCLMWFPSTKAINQQSHQTFLTYSRSVLVRSRSAKQVCIRSIYSCYSDILMVSIRPLASRSNYTTAMTHWWTPLRMETSCIQLKEPKHSIQTLCHKFSISSMSLPPINTFKSFYQPPELLWRLLNREAMSKYNCLTLLYDYIAIYFCLVFFC